MLPPNLRAPREDRETRSDGVFLGGQVGEAPALVSEVRTIARVVDIRLRWGKRRQSALAPSGTSAGNAVTRGVTDDHTLHVTGRAADLKLTLPIAEES